MASALKSADTELLAAVCEQILDVDYKKLGEKLGCTPTAAYKRWRRFREKNFPDEKFMDEKKGKSKDTVNAKGGSGGSAKKRGRAVDGEDGEETTPAKKRATKEGAKAKKSQVVTAEDEGDKLVENDDHLENGIMEELQEQEYDGEVEEETYADVSE